ncbi:MAG: type II toxin-antitoxin system PemK/MazF family toxin [Chloroflexota bacterium]
MRSSEIVPLGRRVRRGEIYWVEFSPVKGREIDQIHPALVVQNDLGNRYSDTTVVVAITHTIPDKPYPFVVILEPEDCGLKDRGTVNCSQIATIQQVGVSSRLRPPRGEKQVRPIGRLTPEKMDEVEQAIRYNLGLD